MMLSTLTYLFDPLCGWCYGAAPAIERLAQQAGFLVQLSPTGLFAGAGGRIMDAGFAEIAWSHDLRIAEKTGQVFSQAYRSQVLGQHGSRFDSACATLALTAVSLTAPQYELAALKHFQLARYVRGLDITDLRVVTVLLNEIACVAAAERLAQADAELNSVNYARMQHSQALIRSYGMTGVPQIIISDHTGSRLADPEILWGQRAK
ncbi:MULTISPECIES: DsbA family protein [unclassified Undibacterium]|uniref:DsbA family protein n=1 Tax=unclassified Undibacterium TaxID=2630295 RepID=UPI002AC8C919|nr:MULTISPECIES: DsbA family protein [unclassified Undibacterium]MEB0140183.1 DsbA family protein [Undibacterium sp. CCC2.1]MEB0172443.1 DsbA family protein [Undibacterium sp. CCC1.1]MEB0176961.1 DsbA family protein [Undibacterium sp. CCC3.4]MEB0215565.1 DsbA family protein [Undibacterium sp. 5I2]WPX43728.1 DsbA family protein [Undibacterium sp. CCC3.4]